jgi:hypothetical protein
MVGLWAVNPNDGESSSANRNMIVTLQRQLATKTQVKTAVLRPYYGRRRQAILTELTETICIRSNVPRSRPGPCCIAVKMWLGWI